MITKNNQHEKLIVWSLLLKTGLVVSLIEFVVYLLLKQLHLPFPWFVEMVNGLVLFSLSPLMVYLLIFRPVLKPYIRRSLELEAYFKALDNGAIISRTDKHGKITYINENFSAISGYTSHEVLGKSHSILNSGYHSVEFFLDMWKTIKAGNVWRGVIKNKKKNGEYYWVYSIIAPVFDQNHEIFKYISIRYDITKEKESEEILELERAKTIQSAKLASLGEISAGIAHEINNPLAVISGNVEILRMNLDEKGQARADKIDQSMEKIQKIIKGLKRFVHASDHVKTPVKVKKIVEETMTLAEIKLKKFNVKADLELCPDVEVVANETEIEQVLINLVNNAIDAIKHQEVRWVKAKVFARGSKAIIQISDSGLGIPLLTQEKLFQPFFTTKEVGEGTGLGLSISRHIIEDHKGTLKILATENTTFEIELERRNE